VLLGELHDLARTEHGALEVLRAAVLGVVAADEKDEREPACGRGDLLCTLEITVEVAAVLGLPGELPVLERRIRRLAAEPAAGAGA
jgi:hypothetical protein